jgi:DNA polymerase III epsilon subunit-like protein
MAHKTALMQAELAVVDVETTGLNRYGRDSITEISVMRVHHATLQVIEQRCVKVFPTTRVHPKAAAINGYDVKVWKKEALPIWQALGEVTPLLHNARLVGWNPAFDWGFIQRAYDDYFKPPTLIARLGKAYMRFTEPDLVQESWPQYFPKLVTYRLVDVCSLAWPLTRAGYIESGSLVEVSKFLGVDQDGGRAHTAATDTLRTLGVLRKLLDAYGPGITALGWTDEGEEPATEAQ